MKQKIFWQKKTSSGTFF